MTETETAIVRRVDELQPWLVEQARALIVIPTVNPYAGDPEAPGKAAGQAWIESRLRDLGGGACPAHPGPLRPCVRMALAAAREATGETPTAGTMPAWFDGARLAMVLRITVIGLGHGELGQAHSASERVPLANLKAGSRTLALLLVRLFNTWPG